MPAPLTVLVAGASGMIGRPLLASLADAGHTVLRLVRGRPGSAQEFAWRPGNHAIDPELMERADAVVNLSGASLSRLPWTPAYRRELVSSRLSATRTLTDAMAAATDPPRVFVSASAVGYYGDRQGETLQEDSGAGSGFLADLVVSWEAAAREAPAGVRVVQPRTGLVIGAGGALAPLLPITRLGLAGPLGNGRQHWPWISLHDEVAAIVHLLHSSLSGPVNLVGPTPAIQRQVAATLAAALHRPAVLRVPSWAITSALGDAGRELLLADQLVASTRLEQDGFAFAHRTIADAVGALALVRARPA
ncbi:MAG TPA: TIGR01777 family oxidoreductase [Humibacter sp.]|nr:TIGR01777 family oxidoreductase [Humibacter sp.]